MSKYYAQFQYLRSAQEGSVGTYNPFAITQDSQRLISIGEKSNVDIRHLKTGTLLHTLIPKMKRSLNGVLLSPDDQNLYFYGGGEVYIWNLKSLQLLMATGHSPRDVFAREWKEQQERLNPKSPYEIVYDIQARGLDRKFTYSPNPDDTPRVKGEGRINSIVLDSYRERLYFGRSYGGSSVWNIVTQAWEPGGFNCKVSAVSGNGEIMAGYCRGGLTTWQLSDLSASRPKRIYQKYIEDRGSKSCAVISMVVNDDGTVAYCGYLGGDIELWRTDQFESLGLLEGPDISISKLALSPDGRILASGDSEGLIKLWDLDTQTELLTLANHTRAITALAFSPDGTLLVSSSFDGTIKLWGNANALD